MSEKNTQQLSQEVREIKVMLRQLKDLLYELDTLRVRVKDEDIDKFDSSTFTLRKSITNIIKDYAGVLNKIYMCTIKQGMCILKLTLKFLHT